MTKQKGRPLRRQCCISVDMAMSGSCNHQYRMRSSVLGGTISLPAVILMGAGGRTVLLIGNRGDANGDGPCLKQSSRNAAACWR